MLLFCQETLCVILLQFRLISRQKEITRASWDGRAEPAAGDTSA